MSVTPLPLPRFIAQVWADAFRAVSAMPGVAATGLGLLIVLGLVRDVAPAVLGYDAAAETLGTSLMVGAALGMAQGYLGAPLAIAIHRHILLGEVTHSYGLNPADTRLLRFVYFDFTITLVQAILFFLAILIFPGAFGQTPGGEDAELGTTVTMSIMLAVGMVLARVIIVFPAIAVDARGASWGNAWRATEGRFWIIALVFLGAVAPVALIWFVLLGIIRGSQFTQTYFMLYEMVSLCIYAAAAARLYQAFGGPLDQPPDNADTTGSTV